MKLRIQIFENPRTQRMLGLFGPILVHANTFELEVCNMQWSVANKRSFLQIVSHSEGFLENRKGLDLHATF